MNGTNDLPDVSAAARRVESREKLGQRRWRVAVRWTLLDVNGC